MATAAGSFKVLSGGEDVYDELEGGIRLTHATGRQAFSGDIDADGSVHWLMLYRGDRTAQFVGLQRITGRSAAIEARWSWPRRGATTGRHR